MHACQRAWVSDYLADTPLIDFVASFFGYDYFH